MYGRERERERERDRAAKEVLRVSLLLASGTTKTGTTNARQDNKEQKKTKMSFLAALRVNAPEVTEEEAPQVGGATVTKAVIDTNAIVKGFRLERFAEEAVTISEVLAEVKDKQARHTLASLPFELKIKDPDEVRDGNGAAAAAGRRAARRDTTSTSLPRPLTHSRTHSFTSFFASLDAKGGSFTP